MSTAGTVYVVNRQRGCILNSALIKRLARAIFSALHVSAASELGLFFVGSSEMAQLNEKFLGHQGPTDVITFDYQVPHPSKQSTLLEKAVLHGEVFICLEVAISQSQSFRTEWREELSRYIIHGILHLAGFDDIATADRRRMKRVESRLLAKAASQFDLPKLARKR